MSSTPLVDFQVYKKKMGLPTASNDEIEQEVTSRKFSKSFPLHVFHKASKPFIADLHQEYNIPKSFIGLSMLSAYSAAIGSAYHIKIRKLGDIYFPVWAALVGTSSSGKSLIMNQIFKPLFKIQGELEDDWFAMSADYTAEKRAFSQIPQLIYGEAHIPTLIKDIMPANPKGILQDADEILTWINGMNQLSKGGKEGTDEQFWMKSWNCRSHRKRLSGNQFFVIKRPFLNVFGGVQPSVMWKLFKNDRGTTGFIFRLLFALPEENKIAEPNLMFDMPHEYEALHEKCITSLYKGLPVRESEDDGKHMLLAPDAIKIYMLWSQKKVRQVNQITDLVKLELYSGVIGKIKEYCLRFAGILHISDKAYNGENFKIEEIISSDTMLRAIELADYFFDSACEVSDRVNKDVIASVTVLRFGTYVSSGYTYKQIGQLEWPGISPASATKRAERNLKKYIQEHPKVFRANSKS